MDPAPLTALITTAGVVVVAVMRWAVAPLIKQRSAAIEALVEVKKGMVRLEAELSQVRASVDALREFRDSTVYRPPSEGR